MVSPEDKRAAVAHVRRAHGASERRACGLVGQPRSTQRYEARAKPENSLLKRIAELAAERPRFGYRPLTASLNVLFFTLSSSFRNFVASENPV